jgi:hypothetical protein
VIWLTLHWDRGVSGFRSALESYSRKKHAEFPFRLNGDTAAGGAEDSWQLHFRAILIIIPR